jgi:hypothetical protein
MTKRDNELTRPELLDKRVKQLLDKWEMHRGQLPQDLITALEGVRKAHDMPYVRSGVHDPVAGVDVPHTGPVPWWNPVHEPPKDVEDANRPVPVVSEPVPAVAPVAPAKPGDLT